MDEKIVCKWCVWWQRPDNSDPIVLGEHNIRDFLSPLDPHVEATSGNAEMGR